MSGSNPVQFADDNSKEGETRMLTSGSDDMPRENPCAQCGEPIAAPEWIEAGPRRTCYLWNCRACNYRFEAMAIFEQSDTKAIAA
jgi:hypothetical protein